jgi:hypothetical protein
MKHDEIREFYVKMNSRINPKADKLTKEEKRLLISATEGSGEYIVLSNIAQLPGDVVLVKDKRHLYDYNDRSLTAMYYEAFQSLIRRKFIRYVGGVLYQLTGSGWQKGKELMNTKITDFNELIEIADDRFVQNQQQCKKKFERWYIAYQLLPLPTEKPLDELKQILMNVNTINANASNENNGSLEIWLKELHRYWYANPFGFYYETQPLPEDINESIFLAPSGYKILEWTNPIQDMTACIIHSIKVANLYKNIEQIRFSVKYHGLRDRILLNIHLKNTLNGPSFHSNQEFNFICRVDEWNNEIQLSPNIETQQLTDDLMNVVKSLLNPLYEKFNYQITDNVYREVISRMFKL